jgi:subtilisin family serine protease
MFAYLERAGMIRGVTPLQRPDGPGAGPLARAAPLPPGMALFAAQQPTAPQVPSPLDGACLLELERSQDLAELRLALAGDPSVAGVSRVPIRYLAGRRPRAAAGGRTEGRARNKAAATAAATGALPPGAAAAAPPDPEPWNLGKIRWRAARQLAGFHDADAIKVAVLDTGIDLAHPDLQQAVSSYTYEHPGLPGASGPRDIVGHGTHVAGTIIARINNQIGINGICNCELHVWKIFADQPTYFDGAGWLYLVNPVMYLRALDDCLRLGIDVLNLSIAGRGLPSAEEREAFDALTAQGCAVVAAMGNERRLSSPTAYPAAIPGVLAVGATSIDDRVAMFSNRGNHIALTAPGTAIWSTMPTYPGQRGFETILGPDGKPQQGKAIQREEHYHADNGTSMAAPHVAAGVALLLANRGRMPVAAVRQALATSCDRVPDMGGANWHPDFGFGRLNLEALLR